MPLQCVSLFDRLIKRESDRPQLGIKDLHTSSAQILRRDLHSFPCLHTAAAPTWPSSQRDPSIHHIHIPALFFSCPALRGSLSCGVVVQYDGPDHWFFARGSLPPLASLSSLAGCKIDTCLGAGQGQTPFGKPVLQKAWRPAGPGC